ncbi:MAG TPA: autotransporter-associated beta strand repeat-containing protein, partial [Kiritimatiellia bacterium]|nr:autotransporter-associated beta strand repeat-containing protein [Kiritimatiellia bacterium]
MRNGALVLTGANGAITASSSFTVNHGATLRLENSAAANNGNRLRDASNVTLNGGTLHFANDGGAVSFSESAATLTIAQNACTVRSDPAGAGQTSTLTFAAFARTAGAAVNFTGESLGDPDGRNTIKLTGQAEGLIGPWATVNGTHLAAYSTARGVYASPEPAYDADIAARGPSSVILDAPTANVRINSDGVAGAIQLGSATTRILSLTQNTATDAIVDTAGKTFRTSGVIVPADKAAVTLGAAPGDGTLTALAAGGDVALHSGTASGGVTVNAVIANNTSASTLTKQGDGTAVLAAPNTFSGLTAIGGGSLLLAHPDALQNSTLAGPGAFFDAAAGSAFAVGGLTGSFPLRLENHAGAPIQLTLGRGNASASHNGVLSGLGGLTKTGTATQTLSGVNTFQGGVTVSQGTLSIGNAAALGTGPVINNGTLNLTAGGVTYTGLSDSLSGAGTVNVTLTTGAGTTYLHGDYSGFTGIWNLGVNAAANAAKAYMNGADNSAATINVLSNAALYCNGGTPHQAHLTLKGGNTGEPYGQLRLENNAVWAGPVTLAGPITSGEDGTVGGSGGTGYIRGDITDDGIPRPL